MAFLLWTMVDFERLLVGWDDDVDDVDAVAADVELVAVVT